MNCHVFRIFLTLPSHPELLRFCFLYFNFDSSGIDLGVQGGALGAETQNNGPGSEKVERSRELELTDVRSIYFRYFLPNSLLI